MLREQLEHVLEQRSAAPSSRVARRNRSCRESTCAVGSAAQGTTRIVFGSAFKHDVDLGRADRALVVRIFARDGLQEDALRADACPSSANFSAGMILPRGTPAMSGMIASTSEMPCSLKNCWMTLIVRCLERAHELLRQKRRTARAKTDWSQTSIRDAIARRRRTTARCAPEMPRSRHRARRASTSSSGASVCTPCECNEFTLIRFVPASRSNVPTGASARLRARDHIVRRAGAASGFSR